MIFDEFWLSMFIVAFILCLINIGLHIGFAIFELKKSFKSRK